MITLAKMCAKVPCDTRAARVAMRAAKWDKPSDTWACPVGKAALFERKLRDLMKETKK
jgi:hypothetical protein